MAIEFYSEVDSCPDGTEEFLAKVVDSCFKIEGVSNCSMMIRVVDDSTIRDINRSTRLIDSATDVLSFPTVNYPSGKYARDVPKLLKREYDPSCGYNNLGDCILNIDRAAQQAEEFGHSLRRELGYLTAHSAFHLMGYDHMTEEDKRLMRSREKLVMEDLELYRVPDKGGSEMSEINEALIRDMIDKAKKVRLNAYAPYSKFLVGACILADSGETYVGANFENSAFGAGTCAERCAIASFVAAGERRVRAIAIVANYAAWPCGICRQALREFCVSTSMPIYVAGCDSETYAVKTLGELLPESFGPDALDDII